MIKILIFQISLNFVRPVFLVHPSIFWKKIISFIPVLFSRPLQKERKLSLHLLFSRRKEKKRTYSSLVKIFSRSYSFSFFSGERTLTRRKLMLWFSQIHSCSRCTSHSARSTSILWGDHRLHQHLLWTGTGSRSCPGSVSLNRGSEGHYSFLKKVSVQCWTDHPMNQNSFLHLEESPLRCMHSFSIKGLSSWYEAFFLFQIVKLPGLSQDEIFFSPPKIPLSRGTKLWIAHRVICQVLFFVSHLFDKLQNSGMDVFLFFEKKTASVDISRTRGLPPLFFREKKSSRRVTSTHFLFLLAVGHFAPIATICWTWLMFWISCSSTVKIYSLSELSEDSRVNCQRRRRWGVVVLVPAVPTLCITHPIVKYRLRRIQFSVFSSLTRSISLNWTIVFFFEKEMYAHDSYDDRDDGTIEWQLFRWY